MLILSSSSSLSKLFAGNLRGNLHSIHTKPHNNKNNGFDPGDLFGRLIATYNVPHWGEGHKVAQHSPYTYRIWNICAKIHTVYNHPLPLNTGYARYKPACTMMIEVKYRPIMVVNILFSLHLLLLIKTSHECVFHTAIVRPKHCYNISVGI